MSICQSKMMDYAKAFAKASWSKRFCIYLIFHFFEILSFVSPGQNTPSSISPSAPLKRGLFPVHNIFPVQSLHPSASQYYRPSFFLNDAWSVCQEIIFVQWNPEVPFRNRNLLWASKVASIWLYLNWNIPKVCNQKCSPANVQELVNMLAHLSLGVGKHLFGLC